LTPLVEQQLGNRFGDARWFAVKLLERDGFAFSHAAPLLTETADQLRREIENQTGDEADLLIADSRYGFIGLLVQKSLTRQSELGRKLSDNIDNVMLNRFLSIPIFFGVMYVMFTFTIKLGRAFKPLFNDLAQALTLFAAAFFPDNGGMVVFSLYTIGVVFAVLTALLLKNTFLKEEFSLVMMETPNYHVPKLKNVLINSWTRVKAFVLRVGKIIITMVVLLNILSSLGTDGSFKANNIERSVLSAAG